MVNLLACLVIEKPIDICYNILRKRGERQHMKIVICDDCSKDIDIAKEIILSQGLFCHADIKTYTSGKELLADVHRGEEFDIAFLDVDMPQINGLELGMELRRLFEKIIIVFISAYPEYAISAFNCEAFSYLTKPLKRSEETDDVLKRLYIKFQKNFAYLSVKINTEYRRISIPDIIYVECYKRHIIYHTEKGSCETTETLSDVYEKLKDYGFYQAHQGYIVNFDKVALFDKYTVVMSNGKVLPLSRRRKIDMMLAYSEYAEVHYL